MPEERIPSTPPAASQPIEEEEHIAERVRERKAPLPRKEEDVNKGGLGPRG